MPWTYLFLHFLASFTSFVMAGAQCKTEISIPGMALDGFVFKIISVTAPRQCDIRCEREIKCQSFNYVIGEKVCELNNRTKEARPLNFRADPTRFYIRRFVGRVPLGSVPELPAISCQEIEASEGKYNISNKHWLDSSYTGQAELVDCSDTVKDCDANPCKNGGTCIEVPSAKTYKCNCTDAFTGKNCSESTTVAQSTDASPTVASLDRGNGEPQNGNDYDFELIFRKTQNTSYVKHDMNYKWVSHFTVCAWIHTPDLQQSQKMTVISILNENGGNQNVVRLRIDGEGNIYFSFGSDRTSLSNVFATSSPKDEMVFLCVRIQPDQSPKMEAIVNANFGSKKTSDGVKYENVQWTQVIVGQNQGNDGTITNDTPFYGRISNLNIWFNSLTDAHITNWYNEVQKNYKPNILKWPELGSSSRIGDVHFVKVTSAERQWRDVLDSEVDVQTTNNVSAMRPFESGSGVVIEVERQSPVSCSNATDSATVDGVLISVSGSWKRIKYKQTFMETQKCFAIFGSVPNWAASIFTPGVSEFDLDLDELWKEEYLGPNGNHFDGVNALCGDEHFWMVNQQNTPVAGVSLRRESGASNAGISTFGKCGMFKFKISEIRVLECHDRNVTWHPKQRLRKRRNTLLPLGPLTG